MNAKLGVATPPEVRARIHAMRASGMTYQQIAEETGVALSTAHRVASQPTDGSERIKPNGEILVALTPEQAGQLPGQEHLGIAGAILSERDARLAVSLKQRVEQAVVERGMYPDSQTLMADLRRKSSGVPANWSHHEVVSALHQLRKQGMVKFRVDKKPSAGHSVGNLGGGAPVQIVPTRAALDLHGRPSTIKPGAETNGQTVHPVRPPELENKVTGSHPAGWSRARHAAGRDYTEPRYHGSRATAVGPLERSRVSAPETPAEVPVAAPEPQAQPDQFPLLTELQQRLRGREEAAARSARLVEAAALLAEDDPEESARLMAKAESLEGEAFSSVEVEYLRFAEAHRG